MDINFSDSIARLRSRCTSFNSSNINKENVSSGEENFSVAKIRMPETDKYPNSDTFVSSSEEQSEAKAMNKNNKNETLSVMHYKNAARAAAAMSQYRLNSSIALRKLASSSDKNIP